MQSTHVPPPRRHTSAAHEMHSRGRSSPPVSNAHGPHRTPHILLVRAFLLTTATASEADHLTGARNYQHARKPRIRFHPPTGPTRQVQHRISPSAPRMALHQRAGTTAPFRVRAFLYLATGQGRF